MIYVLEKFGFLAGSFFEAFASIDRSLQPLASLPPQAVGPPFLYKPATILPETSPDKPSAQKIRVLTYLLSEHKFLFPRPEAKQFYPDFASNLNFLFNRGSPAFLLAPILTPAKFPSSPILLTFCYPVREKNLTRRVQNVRLAMSAAMGTCGDYAIYRTEGELSKAVP